MNTTNKGKMNKSQLLDFFFVAGYNADDLKTAFKTANFTAKMLTELYVAWARVGLHPAAGDFQEASWSEIRTAFEGRFQHALPMEAPESRMHLRQLWLECMWVNRDVVSIDQEIAPEDHTGDEDNEEQQGQPEGLTRDDAKSDLEQLEEIRLLKEEAAQAKEAQASRAQRAQKDKDYAAQREKLRDEIASYKRPQQLGSNSWSNVQSDASKEAELLLQKSKKQRLDGEKLQDEEQRFQERVEQKTKENELQREKERLEQQRRARDRDSKGREDQTPKGRGADIDQRAALALTRKKEYETAKARAEELGRRQDALDEQDREAGDRTGNRETPTNHESLCRMTKGLDKSGLVMMVSSFRMADAMLGRCSVESILRAGLNEVEAALHQDHGGHAMTVVSEVTRLVTGTFPPKILDILRNNPRDFWPLAACTRKNLESMGTTESFLVQLQVANGVTNTKSTMGKLEEKWETINDLIEPLRRLTTLILAFYPIYGQCLLGLLGLVTRELTYHKQDRQKLMPFEVERMKQYVEIVRQRFGGKQLSAAYIAKFFVFDQTILEEAKNAIYEQRSLEQRKEAEKTEAEADGKTPDEKIPKGKVQKNYCPKFNTEAGCDIAKCPQVHRCIICGEQGHTRKNCTQRDKKK